MQDEFVRRQKEQESGKKLAESAESEKNVACVIARDVMRRRLRRGVKPSDEIGRLLRLWAGECAVAGRPLLAVRAKRTLIDRTPGRDKGTLKVDAAKWKALKEKNCGPSLLSPVDIEAAKVKKSKYFRWLRIYGLWNKKKYCKISNVGETVVGVIQGDAYMSGGPLFGKYKFDSFHFHYGKNNQDGTEHAFNGERFALEMHFVFHADSCEGYPPKVAKAQHTKVVLAILFKESNEASYYEIFSLIEHIKTWGKELFVTNNLLHDFKEVLSSPDYYNYVGSFTMEPYCSGHVEWIIFKKILPIQKNQLDQLWHLRTLHCIEPNVRSCQPVGQRTIFEPSYKEHAKCRRMPVCEC